MNTEVNAGMKPTFVKLTVNLPDSVVTIHFTTILHTVLHLEFYKSNISETGFVSINGCKRRRGSYSVEPIKKQLTLWRTRDEG